MGQFYRDAPIRSRDELEDYLSGDTVQCFLCGNQYKNLGIHLAHGHDEWGVDDYREKYDIPWGIGLVGRSSARKYSETAKKNIENGVTGMTAEKRKKAHEAAKTQRKSASWVSDENAQKVMEAAGHESLEYRDFVEVVRRIEEGLSPDEACDDDNLPARTTFQELLAEGDALQERYDRAIENLPYPVLAKMESLHRSNDFREKIKSLYESGMTCEQVADEVGVATMTVWRHLQKIGAEMRRSGPPVNEDESNCDDVPEVDG